MRISLACSRRTISKPNVKTDSISSTFVCVWVSHVCTELQYSRCGQTSVYVEGLRLSLNVGNIFSPINSIVNTLASFFYEVTTQVLSELKGLP